MTINIPARFALALLAPINVVRSESRPPRYTASGHRHRHRALRATHAVARRSKDGFVIAYFVRWAGGRKAEDVSGVAACGQSRGPISHREAP
jgi:hypothetical protein